MGSDWQRVERPAAGVALDVPAGWEVDEDIPRTLLLASEPPVDEGLVRRNLVVTVDDVTREEMADLDAFTAHRREQLAGVVPTLQVIDVEGTRVGSHPAVRQLCHHVTEGLSMTLEQWLVDAGDRLVTLSATCGTVEYADMAPLSRHVITNMQVDKGRR